MFPPGAVAANARKRAQRRSSCEVAVALACLASLCPGAYSAQIALSTLPEREGVELTVYKDVDLSLVREHRLIRFHQGRNDIAFSWADTLIDPTSVRIIVKGEGVELAEVSYPPEQPNTLVWQIEARSEGEYQVEVRYFTSGIRWDAAYQLILANDEKTAEFRGYFNVNNGSGETYETAQVALLTGGVRMVEAVAQLAAEGMQQELDRRDKMAGAYGGLDYGGGGFGGMGGGMMGQGMAPAPTTEGAPPVSADVDLGVRRAFAEEPLFVAGAQAVSEHHRYDISARQTLESAWTTRLAFTSADAVALKALCKWDSNRGSAPPTWTYKFENSRDNGLGESPLPAGPMSIFVRDGSGRLVFLCSSGLEYTGPGQEAEVPGGPAQDVVVEHRLSRAAKGGHVLDDYQRIAGMQELHEFELVVRNRRTLPIDLEATCFLQNLPLELINTEGATLGNYTLKWTLGLQPDEESKRRYAVRYFHGVREPLATPAPEVLPQ